jgi:hypothetical protein
MPVTIATEQGIRSGRARRTAGVFLRYRIADALLIVWAVTVLLIAAHVTFGDHSAFLGDFDVSVAPF